MRFKFVVEVEVQRTRGKFASRDEIADQIREALEGADPQTYTGGNEGEYETASWDVNEEETDAARKPATSQKGATT